MRIILASVLFLMACNAGITSSANPVWVATVQASLPGNIMSDDVPESMRPKPHYYRHVYILLPAAATVFVDSIRYGSGQVAFTIKKLDSFEKPFEVGKEFKNNKPVLLQPVQNKSWWMISIGEEDETFNTTEKMTAALMVYLRQNDTTHVITIDHELMIAPEERY